MVDVCSDGMQDVRIQTCLDVLTPVQVKAFRLFPRGRTARRQLFIENAPADMLEFCVRRFESGTADEREIVSFIVNRHFGFSDSSLKSNAYWSERDADFCKAFQACFDLIAPSVPHLPMKLETAIDLIDIMPAALKRNGLPVTHETLRARFLTNVITYRLPSRTKITDSYRNFIQSNHVAIERNLSTILERKLYQARDIRTITDTHQSLVDGSL